jgi:hypothetical protein
MSVILGALRDLRARPACPLAALGAPIYSNWRAGRESVRATLSEWLEGMVTKPARFVRLSVFRRNRWNKNFIAP